MDSVTAHKRAEEIRGQIAAAEELLRALKAQLEAVEAAGRKSQQQQQQRPWKWPLQAQEYERYSRQLVLPSVGIQGP